MTVCLPGLTSALAATKWTTTIVTPQAANKGVATATYSMALASGQFSPDTETVSGAFSATLTQTFGSSSTYYGCTETTTFTGGTWTTTAQPKAPATGTLAVTGAIGTTDRTNCNTATENATGLTPSAYDAAVNTGAGKAFNVQGTTLTISGGGGGGGLPYGDKMDWTFTESP